MNKKKKEKVCKNCGRIITDPRNKIGICNSCKSKGTVAFCVAGAIFSFVYKHRGPITRVLITSANKFLDISKKSFNFFKK